MSKDPRFSAAQALNLKGHTVAQKIVGTYGQNIGAAKYQTGSGSYRALHDYYAERLADLTEMMKVQ